MTDRIALILFLVIVGLLGLDLWQGWGGTLFLLKKADAFLEWVKFWR